MKEEPNEIIEINKSNEMKQIPKQINKQIKSINDIIYETKQFLLHQTQSQSIEMTLFFSSKNASNYKKIVPFLCGNKKFLFVIKINECITALFINSNTSFKNDSYQLNTTNCRFFSLFSPFSSVLLSEQ